MNIEDALSDGFSDDLAKFNASHNEEQEEPRIKDIPQQEEEPEENEEELEDEEESSEEQENVYNVLAKELGFEAEDLDKYEASTEGLLSFVKDYTTHQSQSVEDSVYNYIEQEHPIVADILSQAYNNNLPASEVIKNYYETLNFEPIVVEENDVESLRSVVQQQMESTGYFTPEEIEQKLDSLQDSGQLYAKAKPILDNYNLAKETEKNQMLEKEQQRLQVLENRAKQQGEQLLKLINERKLANITIPEKDIQPFASFVNERLDRDNEGNLYIKTYFNNLNDLETEFIKYRGGVTNIKDLVGLKANSELAKKLFTSSKTKPKESVDEGFKQIFGHLRK